MHLLTAKEAAQYLRVSLFTLGRMEKEGLLEPFRTPGGHRRYSQEMLDDYLEASRSQRPTHERRILVVGAGEELTGALARAFPTCRFTSARDELEVGMKLAAFRPDLVLVDRAARHVDAQGLCERISEQNRDVRSLPFYRPQREAKGLQGSKVDPLLLDGLSASISAAFDLDHRRQR
jgi:excisionase family DNA binding protein